MTIIQIILSFCIVGFIQFWWNRRRFRELADKIPGPKGLPIIGVIHEAFGLNATGEIVELMSDESNQKLNFFRGILRADARD
jgi:hypothetical protein